MSKPLLVASILLALLIPSYYTYHQYSTLRAISSYDSCVNAKGSVIQTSYPATCVTKLGSSFIQNDADSNIASWVNYANDTYHYELRLPPSFTQMPSFWNYTFPSLWRFHKGTFNLTQFDPNYLEQQNLTITADPKLGPLRDLNAKNPIGYTQDDFNTAATKSCNPSNPEVDQKLTNPVIANTQNYLQLSGLSSTLKDTQYRFHAVCFQHHGTNFIVAYDNYQTQAYDPLFDKILSTFRFTD